LRISNDLRHVHSAKAPIRKNKITSNRTNWNWATVNTAIGSITMRDTGNRLQNS